MINFRPVKSKTHGEKIHFERRCFERLGFVVPQNVLIKDLRTGNLEFYDRISNRVTRYLWKYEGKEYVLVYDKKRSCFVTILIKSIIDARKAEVKARKNEVKASKRIKLPNFGLYTAKNPKIVFVIPMDKRDLNYPWIVMNATRTARLFYSHSREECIQWCIDNHKDYIAAEIPGKEEKKDEETSKEEETKNKGFTITCN